MAALPGLPEPGRGRVLINHKGNGLEKVCFGEEKACSSPVAINKLPQTVRLSCHSFIIPWFPGVRRQVQPSGVLCSGFHKAAIKVSAGLAVLSGSSCKLTWLLTEFGSLRF